MRLFILLAINIVSLIVGQILLKLGMQSLGGFSLEQLMSNPLVVFRIVFNPYIFIGMIFYVVNFLLWFDVISKANLSYAYPFLSLSYAGVVIASALILGEPVGWQRILGVLIIAVGVYVVSQS